MSEENRELHEAMSKKPWWEEHPELLNPKLPGSTPRSQTAKPKPVADTDWKRPRLAKPLAADWPRWTFAPPDTGALVGMKLAALVQSPVLSTLVGADLAKQWPAATPQVDEVWVSIRPLGGQRVDAVILLIGSAVESIATDLRSKGVTVCFLDQRTVLVGEWNAVNQALQRVAAGVPGPMSKRAGELWSSSDLWLIASQQMLNQLLPPSTGTSGLTGASLGLSLQDRVSINMLLIGATPAETKRWASKLSQNPTDLGLGQVSVEKTVRGVSVRADLDPTQLPDALKHQIADQIRPMLEMTGKPPSSVAASGGVIKIQGLDEGTRTIPVQKPQQ